MPNWNKLKAYARQFIEGFRRQFLERFPKKQRRIVLLGLGGFVLLFFILIFSHNSGRSERSSRQAVTAAPAAVAGIPVEDLFFPAEPDFLPDFLLEREPRGFWTAEDAMPYWRNPAHPSLWTDIIRSEIDRLMEGVP